MQRANLYSALFLFFSLSINSYAAHYHEEVDQYPPWHEGRGLGQLSLEVTTQNNTARRHFENGLKLVHLYEFSEATWSFQEAQELDPGFAMAYWGEMLASRMLVWLSRDDKQGADALRRMKANVDFSKLSELERDLISSTSVLIKENELLNPYEKNSSTWQFRNNMEKLYQKYPQNTEVKVLYGYSILGTRRGVRDFKTNHEAIQLFFEALNKNPNHPGALHFLIHATENPVQSYLGKLSAKRLAKIGYGSIHALHMPSHYYITLGDWKTVSDINHYAWLQSIKREKDMGLNDDSREYHGMSWLIYALLQQQKYTEAFSHLNAVYDLYKSKPSHSKSRYLLFARAAFLVDTPVNSEEMDKALAINVNYNGMVSSAVGATIMSSAWVAWQQNDQTKVIDLVNEYQKFMKNDLSKLSPPEYGATLIMEQQTLALGELAKGKQSVAEHRLIKTTEMEDSMVHEHGTPLVVKPANELYADYLFQQKRYGEALLYYRKALDYFPKRKSALDGQAISKNKMDTLLYSP